MWRPVPSETNIARCDVTTNSRSRVTQNAASVLAEAGSLLARRLRAVMPVRVVVGCHCFSNYPTEAEHRALERSSITSSLVPACSPGYVLGAVCSLPFFFKFYFLSFLPFFLPFFLLSDRLSIRLRFIGSCQSRGDTVVTNTNNLKRNLSCVNTELLFLYERRIIILFHALFLNF